MAIFTQCTFNLLHFFTNFSKMNYKKFALQTLLASAFFVGALLNGITAVAHSFNGGNYLVFILLCFICLFSAICFFLDALFSFSEMRNPPPPQGSFEIEHPSNFILFEGIFSKGIPQKAYGYFVIYIPGEGYFIAQMAKTGNFQLEINIYKNGKAVESPEIDPLNCYWCELPHSLNFEK